MLSMSVAGASGKNSTTGAGGPRIPCTRPAGCLHTRSCLLTPRQQYQLADLFSSECHVALEVTWRAYQNIIDAYRAPDTSAGKALMEAEINTLTSTRVPRGLTELITLGRTLKHRARDILAYFDHPHTTGGPTEAINGRLEHLRGSALGLAQPHQLHRPLPPRNRRIQTPTTPSIMKSRSCGRTAVRSRRRRSCGTGACRRTCSRVGRRGCGLFWLTCSRETRCACTRVSSLNLRWGISRIARFF